MRAARLPELGKAGGATSSLGKNRTLGTSAFLRHCKSAQSAGRGLAEVHFADPATVSAGSARNAAIQLTSPYEPDPIMRRGGGLIV
jgi:hypothetical protein